MTLEMTFSEFRLFFSQILFPFISYPPYSLLFLALLLIPLFSFLATSWCFSKYGTIPPTYPYWIPILAHLIPAGLNQPKFFETVVKNCIRTPVRLNMFFTDIFLLSNNEHITSLFNQSQNLTHKAYRKLALARMFGLPQKAQDFIYSDFSGINKKPLAGSTVPENQRIEYLTHTVITKFLTGPSLKPLISRYTVLFQDNLVKCGIVDEWKQLPDLSTFIQEIMFYATAEAIFGKNLLRLSPELTQDYLQYDSGVYQLANRLPRWLAPDAYGARDRCLQAFKRYHHFLREDDKNLRPTGYDTEYDPSASIGAEFVRLRQEMWSKTPAISYEAQASEDFSILWAAHHNASFVTFWLLAELAKSPETRSRFCKAVVATGFTGPDSDPACLNNSAYLSSIWSEALRIHSADTVLRGPNHSDIRIGKWTIPRDKTIAISTWTMHNDEEAWNTGTHLDPHPLREFWDERFIVDEKRNLTGPSKLGVYTKFDAESSGPQFSSKGMEGIFIPFGGGSKICPGRMFAKQKVLFAVAVIVMGYDIEILGSEPKETFKDFGTGILGPEGKTGFKIRRNAVKVREMKERMVAAIEERDRAEDEANTNRIRRAWEVDNLKVKLRNTERDLKIVEQERDESEQQREQLEGQTEKAIKEVRKVNEAIGELRSALDISEKQEVEQKTV